jgi:hypothetical protein
LEVFFIPETKLFDYMSLALLFSFICRNFVQDQSLAREAVILTRVSIHTVCIYSTGCVMLFLLSATEQSAKINIHKVSRALHLPVIGLWHPAQSEPLLAW